MVLMFENSSPKEECTITGTNLPIICGAWYHFPISMTHYIPLWQAYYLNDE
jgi:hypothetical protein